MSRYCLEFDTPIALNNTVSLICVSALLKCRNTGGGRKAELTVGRWSALQEKDNGNPFEGTVDSENCEVKRLN
jgi:hypothetical protein